jgi:hypothetical protein
MAYIIGTLLFILLIMSKFKWFLIMAFIIIYIYERGII